jgi:protein CpxP
MKKNIVIPLALIGLLLSGGAAFARPGHHGQNNSGNFSKENGQGMSQEQHQERVDNRLEKMAVVLDLTDPQKKEIEILMNEKWEKRLAMRTKMQASRKTLREYRQGSEFNESEFRTIAQKHADLKTEMMVQQAKNRQQIFALLTPEQQQKAEKLRGMRGEGFHGRHGGTRNYDGNGQGMLKGKGSGRHYNN